MSRQYKRRAAFDIFDQASTSKEKRVDSRNIINDDDDDDTIIVGEEKDDCKFIYEENTEKTWKSETLDNIEVSLLQNYKTVTVKKTLVGGSTRTLRLSIKECEYITERSSRIQSVCKEIQGSDGVKTAKMEFGDKKLLQFKYFEGEFVVDIRQYFLDGEGAKCPSRNGIMVQPHQLAQILNAVENMLLYL